nr:urease accessory protein UreD [Rhodococcus sp. HNM0569]
MLLAGDEVRLDVRVGAGRSLEIVETSGTVAYDMRGGRASWNVDVTIDADGSLLWDGLPFVVASGSDVARHTTTRLAAGATCTLRETFVSGRTAEDGGCMVATTHAYLDCTPLLVEQLTLDPQSRRDPALLGGARCLDQVTTLGHRLTDPGALQLEGVGSVYRRMGADAHTTRVALRDLL